MKFFVPGSDEAQAEILWAGFRAELADLGLDTTRRRIRALDFDRTSDVRLLEVGGETPDGETVLAILESADLDLFFCYTPRHGLLDPMPLPMALGENGAVIDFDEEVVRWA